ncbi:hypothetical protein M3Y94_00645300 [Aphelenchoides besseyi]|nr:hypothetical protein M3Y94_00645300 [Aphelenchoides besseyi]
MDESQLKVPSRIVLPFSSTASSLSERFAKLRQCALFPHEKQKMAGPRDTRNFLYDDYYEPQQPEEDFGRRPQRGFRSNDLDMELDSYMGRERAGRSYGGRDMGDRSGREFGGRRLDYEQSPPQRARRFASALGLTGGHQDYDEDFGLPQRARQQPRRQQVVRPRSSCLRRHGSAGTTCGRSRRTSSSATTCSSRQNRSDSSTNREEDHRSESPTSDDLAKTSNSTRRPSTTTKTQRRPETWWWNSEEKVRQQQTEVIGR